MIEDYLLYAPKLSCVFLLIDFNIPPQRIDIDFVTWLGESSIPFVLVYTKIDKTKKQKVEAKKGVFNTLWAEQWEPLPKQFYTSTVSHQGLKEMLEFIENILNA